MRILTYTVPPEENGHMVKGILRGDLHLSYTLLKSLKWRENAILLNGQSVHVNAIVHTGDVVSVALSERAPREDLYCEHTARLNIVYEDDDLLVLNKPAGVAMHPKADDASAPSLAAMLTGYLGEGSVPHFVSRLDKGTSGLLIAAKNDFAHLGLAEQLQDHSLYREYEAVCVGTLKEASGTVDAPIARHPADRKRMCVDPKGGRAAVTHWSVLGRYPGHTHIQCRLETGRTHQIRVHMAYIGHPLLGDVVYGAKKPVPGLAGQCLHARRLSFVHPSAGTRVTVECPLPDYFSQALRKLAR